MSFDLLITIGGYLFWVLVILGIAFIALDAHQHSKSFDSTNLEDWEKP